MCNLKVFRLMFYPVTTLSSLPVLGQSKTREIGGQQCHLWVSLSSAALSSAPTVVSIGRVALCL